MLRCIAWVMENYASGIYDSPECIPHNPLRLCRLLCHIVSALRVAQPELDVHADEDWQEVWHNLVRALKAFSEKTYNGAEQAMLAVECLNLMQALEHEDAVDGTEENSYAPWASTFASGTSMLPDDLIEELADFIPDLNNKLQRVRGLEEPQQESQLEAIQEE